jgi:hypothetical protein
MSSSWPASPFVPQKALVYWRKNYLVGVARPGALTFDGNNLTCVDNDLSLVFSGNLSTMTAKKGFGIFKVYIGGERVSFLTPVGGAPSPAPSTRLLEYLDTTGPRSPSDGQVETMELLGAGKILGGVAGNASVAAGAIGQAAVVANYARGNKALGAFLTSIGVLNA